MRRECTHRMAVTRRWRSGSSSFARRRRAGRSETDRMVSLCRRAGTTSHSRYRHLRRQMSRFARHLYCLRSSPRRASSLLLSSSTVSRLCWTHSRPLQACATSGAIPAAATAAPPPPSFSFGPPPPSAEPWPMGVSLPPPTIGAAALTDIALRRRRGASAGGGSRRFLLGSVVTPRPAGSVPTTPPRWLHAASHAPRDLTCAHWIGVRYCHFALSLAPAASSASVHSACPLMHDKTRGVAPS